MPAFDFSGYSTKNYSSPSNTGNNNREKYRSTQYSSQPKTSTFKQSKKKVELATGKSQLDNYQVKKVPAIIPGSTILNAAQKLR